MADFTVIGYYDSTGETFADHIEAQNAEMAVCEAIESRGKTEGGAEDIMIVVAIKGTFNEGVDLTFAGDSVVDGRTYLETMEDDLDGHNG